jgi:hypothetical protein
MFDPSIGEWLEEDPLGFAAGDPNTRRYVGNDGTNALDPSGLEATELPAVDVKTPGNQVVGNRKLQYGDLGPKTGVGIAAVFTSTMGNPKNLKAAAQAYNNKGDHFNWYQVVTEDNNPLSWRKVDTNKKIDVIIALKAPYVDPPPGGYYSANGEAIGDAFDNLPWTYNDDNYGGRMDVTRNTKDPAFTFRDVPLSNKAGTTIKYKAWLVVLDGKGNFVAWAGTGIEWTWSNSSGTPEVSAAKTIQGEPDKELQPEKLFPPR